MDRARSRDNLQDININKVMNQIGLEEKKKYSTIEVFIDSHNQNNLWAVAHYFVERRNKKVSKEEIIRFKDYNEMLFFLQNNFDTYEVNHQVDYINRSIYFHRVDYIGMEYYMHEGREDLNYIKLMYKEYSNNGTYTRERIIDGKYEKMIYDIIRKNKEFDPMFKIDAEFYREINVDEKKVPFIDEDGKEERKTRVQRRIEKEKNQFPMPDEKKKVWFKKPVIYIALITLLTTGGIVLTKTSEFKKEIITQEKPETLSLVDYHIGHEKNKALLIINDLMFNNYEEISEEDLDFLFDYIGKVNSSNFDNNKSGTYFNYEEYFSSMIWDNSKGKASDLSKCGKVLKEIEEKYHNCFKVVDNKLMLRAKSVKAYIEYVSSLTVMYDAIIDQRGSGLVELDGNSRGNYATKEEVEIYNTFPRILKIIIMDQLQNMIYHSDYEISMHPSNYRNGKEITKFDLLNDVRTKISVLKELTRTDSRLYNSKTV